MISSLAAVALRRGPLLPPSPAGQVEAAEGEQGEGGGLGDGSGADCRRSRGSSNAVKPERPPNSCTHFKGFRGHLFGTNYTRGTCLSRVKGNCAPRDAVLNP
jgi:hypothetical protein